MLARDSVFLYMCKEEDGKDDGFQCNNGYI